MYRVMYRMCSVSTCHVCIHLIYMLLCVYVLCLCCVCGCGCGCVRGCRCLPYIMIAIMVLFCIFCMYLLYIVYHVHINIFISSSSNDMYMYMLYSIYQILYISDICLSVHVSSSYLYHLDYHYINITTMQQYNITTYNCTSTSQ